MGGRLLVGDQNFLGWSKMGPDFFQWAKGGNQKFLRVKEGGDQIFFSIFDAIQLRVRGSL